MTPYFWIPACAGMTALFLDSRFRGNDKWKMDDNWEMNDKWEMIHILK